MDADNGGYFEVGVAVTGSYKVEAEAARTDGTSAAYEFGHLATGRKGAVLRPE